MKRRDPHPTTIARPPVGREGLRELLRRPFVQAAIVLTAAVQVAAGTRTLGVSPLDFASAPVVELPAAVVTPSAPARADADDLAAGYRAKGYPVTTTLARSIDEAAQANGIDPEVAFGLVRTESSFKNSATSNVGAIGLTQLMPATARWLEPGTTRNDLRDPETNLNLGFRYLRQLIDRYDGDTRLALLAYNRGPGTVDRVLKRGGNPDNGYADMVLNGGE
ncbi:MAG TPA: lytic transglycosylase domain-containing protein [Longimicrobiaceae bacterium]|nr:lytic transglycosylase domain-containing protein [Longimicrobiaceae bacterium]